MDVSREDVVACAEVFGEGVGHAGGNKGREDGGEDAGYKAEDDYATG